jgi:hypothetical protein
MYFSWAGSPGLNITEYFLEFTRKPNILFQPQFERPFFFEGAGGASSES